MKNPWRIRERIPARSPWADHKKASGQACVLRTQGEAARDAPLAALVTFALSGILEVGKQLSSGDDVRTQVLQASSDGLSQAHGAGTRGDHGCWLGHADHCG